MNSNKNLGSGERNPRFIFRTENCKIECLWLGPQSRQSARLFLQSSELRLLWLGGGGGAHTRLWERGRVSQFRRGDIHCGTVGIHVHVLCASSWILSLFPLNAQAQLGNESRPGSTFPSPFPV